MSIATLTSKGMLIAGRTGLVLQKHAPTILTVTGVAGMVTASVMGAKATLKAGSIKEELKRNLEDIAEATQMANEVSSVAYSSKDQSRDKLVSYSRAVGQYGRLYGPAVTLGALSIVSILVGHNLLHKRNLAIVAAYKGLEETFSNYRDRVKERLGIEKEYEIFHDIREETVVDEETGKKKKVKVAARPNDYSVYARFFDELSSEWRHENGEYNLNFLVHRQNYLNDRLRSRGHVFLNEVYEALGIPHSSTGSVTGWVYENEDSFIDFGLFTNSDNERVRRFVNGDERSILLDFNVDGLIWDKI